ncbi:hypothetical protein AB1Y20_004073 [Prymnesium parvum]|uniref:Uncharacterized protein n=1 Tax=Prymnesium parvum TaxID=97485 RepID=A0AB34J6F0_PRYPA
MGGGGGGGVPVRVCAEDGARAAECGGDGREAAAGAEVEDGGACEEVSERGGQEMVGEQERGAPQLQPHGVQFRRTRVAEAERLRLRRAAGLLPRDAWVAVGVEGR